MPSDQVKNYLGLSDQQLQDLASIQNSLREATASLIHQAGDKRQAVQQNTVDAAAVTQLRSDLDALQTQERNLRAPYKARALAVLTNQQQASLANLQQALDLMQAASQAAALNLLDMPQGFPGRPGFDRR